MDEPGRRKAMGHGGLAGAVAAARGDAATRPALHRRGSATGCRRGRAAELRRLDPTLRREPGRRRHSCRCPRRASHRGGACLRRVSTFPAPGRRCGRPSCLPPDSGKPWSCWEGSVRGSRRDRPPPRSALSCSAWKANAGPAPGRGREWTPFRRFAEPRPGDSAPGADGRRVPSRPGRADRGHPRSSC